MFTPFRLLAAFEAQSSLNVCVLLLCLLCRSVCSYTLWCSQQREKKKEIAVLSYVYAHCKRFDAPEQQQQRPWLAMKTTQINCLNVSCLGVGGGVGKEEPFKG